METEILPINEIKKGEAIVLDGRVCKVTDIAVSAPGKHGHAKVRVEAVGIIDGKKRSIVFSAEDRIEVPKIVKRSAQVLSINNNKAQLMDLESYETIDAEIPEELAGKIKEGDEVSYSQIENIYLIRSLK